MFHTTEYCNDFFDGLEKALNSFISEFHMDKNTKWRLKSWVERTRECCNVLMESDEPEVHSRVHDEMMTLMSKIEWICYTAISAGYMSDFFRKAWRDLVAFYDSFGWWIDDTD